MGWSDFWLNREMNLWHIDKEPVYLGSCAINKIVWKSSMYAVCPYCGSPSNGKCPSCGGVGSEQVHWRLDGAIITLYGFLPEAKYLFSLKDEAELQVVRVECGPRDWYSESDIIAKFLNCKVIERRIDDLTILSPDDADALYLVVEAECDAELIL